jgi:hypothetical protein
MDKIALVAAHLARVPDRIGTECMQTENEHDCSTDELHAVKGTLIAYEIVKE